MAFQIPVDVLLYDLMCIVILFYRSADDVELMIGGAMEKPASGAVVGSTIACVLALQFANLKKSDRYDRMCKCFEQLLFLVRIYTITLQFLKDFNPNFFGYFRFWYENDLPPSSLSPEQLGAIRKVSLAGMLCAAQDSLTSIQPKAFVKEDPYL